MLTIQNINKIVGKQIYIGGYGGGYGLVIANVEDVYEWGHTIYEFKIKVETPNDTKQYKLFLNRKRIPYPQALHNGWELSYEEKPNQLKVHALGKRVLGDMNLFGLALGNLMERILTK